MTKRHKAVINSKKKILLPFEILDLSEKLREISSATDYRLRSRLFRNIVFHTKTRQLGNELNINNDMPPEKQKYLHRAL